MEEHLSNLKTVLIIDDSETMIDVLSFTLKKNNFNVISASGGAEGLKFLDGRKLDLIISDLHMPEPNGIELIKIVRNDSNYKDIPILILTTEAEEKRKFEAKDAGATGWITKPFSPDRLILAVKKIIKN